MSLRPIIFLTSRSQYARVETVLRAITDHPDIDLRTVISGGATVHDYGELRPILEDDGITVDTELRNLIEGGTPEAQAKTTGLELIEFSSVLQSEEPDVVLTTGDRYETMAVTLAASYVNIPVVHFEGGEITGSIDERVRHATTKMSDYHLVSTKRSKRIVEALGEEPSRVLHTGCPSIDLAKDIETNRSGEYDPQDDYSGVGADIDISDGYLVVQYHPLPTDYRNNYDRTWTLIDAIDEINVPTFWFWPNMDAGSDQVSQAIREYREKRDPDHVRFYINLEPEDYLALVKNATCMVGNSSVGIRECSYFGTPTVNIGDRQQFRERGDNVVDVPAKTARIVEAIRTQLDHLRYPSSPLYGDGNATPRIVDFLTSTDFENKGSMDPDRLAFDAVESVERGETTHD